MRLVLVSVHDHGIVLVVEGCIVHTEFMDLLPV